MVCKRPYSGDWPDQTTTPKPSGNCPPDFVGFEGYCFQLVQERMTWDDAESACKSMGDGFNLASIHNDREAAFVTTMVVDIPDGNMTDPWIGLNDIADESFWMWSDRTLYRYGHWAPGQPDGYNGVGNTIIIILIAFKSTANFVQDQNCVKVDGYKESTTAVGYWDDDNCTATKSFICKVAASPDYDPQPPPPKCTVEGHSDFFAFNDACYMWVDSPMSWSEAQKTCADRGSNLVSIIDAMDESYVMTRAKAAASWTGLSNTKVLFFYYFL